MQEFLQMPVNMNLQVIILNTETHPYVISTDGPFYHNDNPVVEENTVTALCKL